MAGLAGEGLLGRIGRSAHTGAGKKWLFGSQGTDFLGLYDKPSAGAAKPSSGAPQNQAVSTPLGTPGIPESGGTEATAANRKNRTRRRSAPTTTPLSSDPSNTLGRAY